MRSIDAVLPASGGITVLVSGTTVVSAATGGRSVGCGVGAPGTSVGVAVGTGVGVGAAVEATATFVGDGDADGAAAEPPQDVMRIAIVARVASHPVLGPIVFPPPFVLRNIRSPDRPR